MCPFSLTAKASSSAGRLPQFHRRNGRMYPPNTPPTVYRQRRYDPPSKVKQRTTQRTRSGRRSGRPQARLGRGKGGPGLTQGQGAEAGKRFCGRPWRQLGNSAQRPRARGGPVTARRGFQGSSQPAEPWASPPPRLPKGVGGRVGRSVGQSAGWKFEQRRRFWRCSVVADVVGPQHVTAFAVERDLVP